MVQVYSSRYTPNVTGDEVHFEIGEIVQYKLVSGNVLDIRIDSERMKHAGCPNLGYEAIFSDDGNRYFADGKRIIDWKGKVD